MRTRAVVLAVASALVLAGCAAAPTFPLVEPTAVLGDDAGAGGRWYSVPVTAGDRPVRVEGAALMSPYFTTTEGVEVGIEIGAGETDTIAVPVGAVTCPAGSGATTVQLILDVDGAEVLQSVELSGDVLEGRHATECGQAAITGTITPGFGEVVASEPTAVRTSVLLVRVSGAEEITLESVTGSEHFSVSAEEGSLPATLAPAGQRLEVPVIIEAARCEGLPFGGAASAFGFSVELSRPGEDPVRVPVRPEGELLATLEDIATTCDALGP